MALTEREKFWAMAASGVVVAIGGAVALWPANPRRRVAAAALSQLGRKDASVYWRDVLAPGYPPADYPKDWCGAFALWSLHRGGLGLGIDWKVGLGFLSEYLPTTASPELGDIAYFTTNEHHAVVTGYDPATDQVALVNGNGLAGSVSANLSPRGRAAAYYSIQPLIDAAHGGSVLPWMLGSTVVAGAAAWALLPSR